MKTTLRVDVYYPDHPPREESPLFSATKRLLIEEKDLPCYICGTREDREVHHFHVEWAFAEAIDWEKMKALHPGFDWSTFTEATDFVDSEYNMMVLCQSHHRMKNRGIHNMPFPIWIIQRYIVSDFPLFDPPPKKV